MVRPTRKSTPAFPTDSCSRSLKIAKVYSTCKSYIAHITYISSQTRSRLQARDDKARRPRGTIDAVDQHIRIYILKIYIVVHHIPLYRARLLKRKEPWGLHELSGRLAPLSRTSLCCLLAPTGVLRLGRAGEGRVGPAKWRTKRNRRQQFPERGTFKS